jgi:hypothetical protein
MVYVLHHCPDRALSQLLRKGKLGKIVDRHKGLVKCIVGRP